MTTMTMMMFEVTASGHEDRSKQLESVAALLGFYLSCRNYIVLVCLMFLPLYKRSFYSILFYLYYSIPFRSVLTCCSVVGA